VLDLHINNSNSKTMTLNKSAYQYILEMIENSSSINSVKAFCEGFGIDTANYSSPVTITEDKISITYRRKTQYVNYMTTKIKTYYF